MASIEQRKNIREEQHMIFRKESVYRVGIILCLIIIIFASIFIGGCSRKKTIGFIPLDTRPCCFDIPLELAKLADADVIYPSMEGLTWFKDQPDTGYVRNWLIENASSCDVLVISMQQLAYGGLIQSRFDNRGMSAREDALQLLRDIKDDYPNIKIYLSSIIMRTSNSIFSKEDEQWTKKVNEYSRAYYYYTLLNQDSYREEFERLSEEIPSEVIDTFLGVRSFNHELNLACIDLVSEGIVDKLVICQEDCEEGGIQIAEQEEILKKIKSLGLEGNVSLANGTDEAGSELLVYAVNPNGCSTSVHWLGDNIEFIAKYEDRMFKENLSEHAKFLNISVEDNAENALCILVPKKQQGDYSSADFEGYEAYTQEELIKMCAEIKELSQSGKHCYILDLDCANGGCVDFLLSLAKTMNIEEIYGYSAWNTASNSLGTVLAQIIANGKTNSSSNKAYTAERILDEAIYQSVVRPILYEEAGQKGINVFNIDDTEEMERELALKFTEQEGIIKEIFGGTVPEYTTALRWPRLFEISVITPK